MSDTTESEKKKGFFINAISLRKFINANRNIICNKVFITLVNPCNKKGSVYRGCNSLVKNNGLPFPLQLESNPEPLSS